MIMDDDVGASLNIEPQNKEPQNFEGFYFIIRYSLLDILRFIE
jgi:hypothetical protein